MDTRKNQAKMTTTERQAFAKALIALKNTIPSQLGLKNRYDDYVQIHIDSMMVNPGWAHQGPAFLPWHRVLLRNLELDLQKVDPSVTLPYWDWTVDQSPTAKGSPWTDDFLGGNGDAAKGGKVMSGPFGATAGKWPVRIVDPGAPAFLARQFAQQVPTLPTADNVKGALGEVPYDAKAWKSGAQPSFRRSHPLPLLLPSRPTPHLAPSTPPTSSSKAASTSSPTSTPASLFNSPLSNT